MGLEQHPIGVGGDDPLEPVAVAQRRAGALERLDRVGAGHRRQTPPPLDVRRCAPHTLASHQRRLPLGGVVGEEERAGLARAAPDRDPACSASVAAADRAIASSAPSGRDGAKRSRQSPPTRVSCWLPAIRASCSLSAAIAAPGGCTAVVQRLGQLGQPIAKLDAPRGTRRGSPASRCCSVAPAAEGREVGKEVGRGSDAPAGAVDEVQPERVAEQGERVDRHEVANRPRPRRCCGRPAWPCTAPCRPRRAGC